MAKYRIFILIILVIQLLGLGFSSCTWNPIGEMNTEPEYIEYYFNSPNTTQYNGTDSLMDDGLIKIINNAQKTLDFAFYGFYHPAIIDAIISAHKRGVRCRHVGSITYKQSRHAGYLALVENDIPSVSGNNPSIMHNKFLIADNRVVFTGTSNITTSGMEHNDNNAMIIYDRDVAADFTREFEQMFNGKFGHSKTLTDNLNVFQVGDTRVEVYFSPHEAPITKFYKALQEATDNVYFMIFAFTKSEMGELMIQAAKRGVQVRGVLDRSQLTHSMHVEVFRLISALQETNGNLQIRMDGNENTYVYGDWQGGGGRLHNKTMIVDAGTDHAKVLTGSFNWSNNANFNNDEVLTIIHSQRAADLFVENWNHQWKNGDDFPGTKSQPGEVIINEVFWAGPVSDDGLGPITHADGSHYPGPFGENEFIELRNMTDQEIDLAYWVIDGITGYPNHPKWNHIGFVEGTIIPPNGYFLITEPHIGENDAILANAFPENDFFLNGYTNNLDYIKLSPPPIEEDDDEDDVSIPVNPFDAHITLKNSLGQIVDEAWNGTNIPLTKGGYEGGISYSMERNPTNPGDGTDPASWHRCTTTDPQYIAPGYELNTRATPRKANSLP